MSSVRDDVRRWGWTRALYAALMRRLRRWLVLCRIHSRPMQDRPTFLEDDPALPVRLLSRQDLLRAVEQMPAQLDRGFVEAALARGDVCAGAYDGDRLVSFVWRSFSMAPHEPGLWVEVQKPFRYGYKAYTHPDYRGRHLVSRIAVHTDRLCLERGFTHAVGFIETHNYSSITADLRHGNVLVGYAGYLHLFGRWLPFRTPGARRHGFRFIRHSPPTEPASADRRD